ncbi:hypothetical protein FB451DRAFT_1422124 [Mycena latifolia]|nr:hypothetical protein FB451DRAFT_1422124 [Mycena latifolia]
MATLRKLTRVTLSRTLTTPTIEPTRDIATHSFKGTVTLKPSNKKACVEATTEFCAQVGLDAMGADHAIIAFVNLTASAIGRLSMLKSFFSSHSAGGPHVNPNDNIDTFKRSTVELLDSNGAPMQFQGTDGRTFNRIHVPEDRNLWPQFENFFTRTK